jgi:two-component system, NtrC family, sensor kinase
VGQLAAGVAHEINNPLSTILLFAEALSRQLPADDKRREDARTIIRETNRCSAIVRGLLNFSRQQEPLAQQIDLRVILDDVLNMMMRREELKDVRVQRTYAPDAAQIQADPAQLQQIFINLIDNAADAMGGKGDITVVTRRLDDRNVEIAITDTGCGIPKSDLGKLYTPFFTTKRAGKGTGLGLSIVYGIIKMHHGQIRAESELGRGTTFTLTFPVRLPKSPEAAEISI